MTTFQYALKSLLYHKRIHLAVALGVAAATAVLVGALVVGDSMRSSLKAITLDRLDRVDEVLISDLFFRQELATELKQQASFQDAYSLAVPAIMLQGSSIEKTNDEGSTNQRASGVNVIGSTREFWNLYTGMDFDALPEIADDEIIINQQLANELNISESDLANDDFRLRLRIPKSQALSEDSLMGEKEEVVENIPRLKVKMILPDKGLARFGLQPSQILPQNAFVSLGLLQDRLEKPDTANTIFVAGKDPKYPPSPASSEKLREALQPKLADVGLILRDVKQSYTPKDAEEKVAFEYKTLSSERMMIDSKLDELIQATSKDASPVFTYLANRIFIKDNDKMEIDRGDTIPFSMVTASDSFKSKNVKDISGNPIEIADDEIVFNSWAADSIGAKVGDTIRVVYYQPETTHGEYIEEHVDLKLSQIVSLTKPLRDFRRSRKAFFDSPPTFANDPDLTPFVPGVTDRESIEDWDLPFETPGIRGVDEDYWESYRTTPKAFVSLQKGRELWGSRFGQTTSFRLSNDTDADELASKLDATAKSKGESLGLVFRPLKRDGLKASSGSTPFDGLFLALSFFIITAAVMLVALLFRLGLEQRASELGVLSSVGLTKQQMSRFMLIESSLVAFLGAVIGVVIGIAYGKLMLIGLTTIWVKAIVTPFLKMHLSPMTIFVGLFCGALICGLTIAGTIWRIKMHSSRSLLNGQLEPELTPEFKEKSWPTFVAIGLTILAVGLLITAVFLPGGEPQAGAFVGGGLMLLSAILIFIWTFLRRYSQKDNESIDLSMNALAVRNASRKPGRSALTIGLVAVATFLIVAISSFHLSPTEEGTGGFDLIAQSDRPVTIDLNSKEKRVDLFGDDAANWNLDQVTALRLKPGADASCNNPYQITQPRILGISSESIQSFGESEQKFAWAGSIADSAEEKANPWLTLQRDLEDDRVPVLIDKNTAMYSLKIFAVGQEFSLTYDDSQEVKFKVAGFLANSVLQGSLIVSEKHFNKLFPNIGGYRYFLIKSQNEDLASVSQQIEGGLAEYGFDAKTTSQVLDSLLAVQNTYLKAFQALGSLGLLLGTFGLATVQLRNVFERRKELALFSALGFPKQWIGKLVLREHFLLLLGGIGVGLICALSSVLPHMLIGSAQVPLGQLLLILAIITGVGLAVGWFAVRSSLKTPVLESLRME